MIFLSHYPLALGVVLFCWFLMIILREFKSNKTYFQVIGLTTLCNIMWQAVMTWLTLRTWCLLTAWDNLWFYFVRCWGTSKLWFEKAAWPSSLALGVRNYQKPRSVWANPHGLPSLLWSTSNLKKRWGLGCSLTHISVHLHESPPALMNNCVPFSFCFSIISTERFPGSKYFPLYSLDLSGILSHNKLWRL